MLYPMLYHEESPEKPQYNIAIPPFLDNPTPLFSHKFSDPPSNSTNFEKFEPSPPHLMKENGERKGGGARTILASTDIDRIIESSL